MSISDKLLALAPLVVVRAVGLGYFWTRTTPDRDIAEWAQQALTDPAYAPYGPGLSDRSDPAHPDHRSWRVTHHLPCDDPYACIHPILLIAHCRFCGEVWPCEGAGRLDQKEDGHG
jgi:hypothetical protein